MSGLRVQEASILVVEDEEMNIELMKAYLAEDGYANVTFTRDPRKALALFAEVRPDLVLLDLHMPHLSGFALLQQLIAATGEDDYVPIIVLTADVNPESKQRALAGGAHDFLTKPLDSGEVQLRIRNTLQTRLLYRQQRAALAAAETAARRASFLAEVSRVLGTSFDYHTTLAKLALLAVPEWADYCVVDLLEGETGLTRAGVAHHLPEKEALLRETTHFTTDTLPPDHPVMQVLRTGEAILVPEITPVMIDLGTGDESHRRIVSQLRPHSMISAPLMASGRAMGVLSLVMAESGRSYTFENLMLTEELARRAALALENARLFRAAQQAIGARDEILAVVVHDLRNPLSTINLAVGLLREELPEGATKNHVQIVGRAVERMSRLVEDLLEVARMETGKLSLELRDEPIGPLLEEASTMLRPLATARSIELECEAAEGLPCARMDVARILQVLSNLVGNAIKFTPPGGRILLFCESIGREIRFAVRDTGPGIPPEQLSHIFGRFWQAQDADRRGIGLGLSIAGGIVEAHQGRIWVESRPGEGSTFFFTVPQTQ